MKKSVLFVTPWSRYPWLDSLAVGRNQGRDSEIGGHREHH